MSNNKFSQKRKIDIILICIIIVMLVIGLILDLGFLIGFNLTDYLPKVIIVDNKSISDILSGVFSAQVSVSTLGIALISILGGVLKETVFGVSISQYLMNDKPIIFKHKINITIELILIACSYITFSLELYNLSVSIFFTSIIIILIMVWDIFPVFYGVEYMRADVKEYYISVFSNRKLQKRNKRETLINNLKGETQLAIDNGNLVEYENNLNLMIEIIEKIFIYSDENDREKILKLYEKNISDIFNKMFKSKDNDKTIIALESMDRIYRKCNELNENSDKKIYLNIFDKVSRQISKPIANLVKYNYDEFDKVLQLEYSLYKNLNIKKENGKSYLINHIHLIGFSRNIYYAILENGFESYNEKILFEVKLDMYKALEDLINSSYSNCANNEEIILQLYNQMYIYTKTLIDNNENMILEKTFLKKIKFYYYNKNDLDKRYIITMIIYMYYLIEFEELASDEFKAKIKHLTKQKIKYISEFLEFSRDIVWETELIETIRNNIFIWELMEKYEVKNSKTDIAVDRFIIFYCIRRSWNISQVDKDIQELLKEKHILRKNYMLNIKSLEKHINVNKYIEFNKLIFNQEIGKKEAQDKIDILKDTINKLYKQAVLDNSRKNKKTVEEYANIEGEIKQSLVDKTN
ncbi:Uncharacterised protein [[Clostridium] sordellii]|uniref:hypothetical protein n=1 Tax=Paraclostridium sordellii TaxID=1505 RepID=UPI0005E87968|nr:hypothetical protein [Paeniclostridium sordellii]CEO06889.1 Uncharacterised protein [[Clostridium] sordellii] [Paeniclostridium sordellii]CEP86705.1 Uncharacterised protein [[Clostridium] sordellii] [Paeniclostridium sordellii]